MSGMPPSKETLQQHGVDAESLMATITAVVDAHPDPRLKDALVSHFTANAHPLHTPSKTDNTNIIVTVADTNTDEIYVLMAQKYKNPLRPELGLEDKLGTIDGYIDPNVNNAAFEAAHKLTEKTKLELPQGFKPEPLGTAEEGYHVNMYGPVENLPKVEAQGDIAALHWVKASSIMHDDTIPVQAHNSDISRFTGVITNPETGNELPIYIKDNIGEPLVKAVMEAKKTLTFLDKNPEGHQLYAQAEPQTYGNDAWPNTTKKDLVEELHTDFHEELADHYEAQKDKTGAPELATLNDAMHDGSVSTRDFALHSLV